MKFSLRRLQPSGKPSHLKVQARDEQYLEAKDSGDSIMSSKIVKPMGVARYVAAFGVAALSLGAVAAHADPVKAVVNYSDLDLSRAADARSLYARLQKASDQVCSVYKDTRNLTRKRLFEACYQDSLTRAVDDIGHASVQAVFVADERIRLASRPSKDRTGS
jgi:UrcA family protein